MDWRLDTGDHDGSLGDAEDPRDAGHGGGGCARVRAREVARDPRDERRSDRVRCSSRGSLTTSTGRALPGRSPPGAVRRVSSILRRRLGRGLFRLSVPRPEIGVTVNALR